MLLRRSFQGIDLMPLFLAIVLAFVTVGAVQFARGLPGGERGLLLFEKACPIYTIPN
jgi:hypothetical protein